MKELTNEQLLSVLVGEAAGALASKTLGELFGFYKPKQMRLCEEPASYIIHPALAAAKELFVRCMRERMEAEDLCFSSPETVKAYICSEIGHLEYESFWGLWLDTQHRLIRAGELFRGTLNQTSVHPREIVKIALGLNAGAVVFAHNHPSGVIEPSHADRVMTQTLQQVLGLVDVRVLDHIIVSGNSSMSFAAKGLL